MSGSVVAGGRDADIRQRWAALDSKHERLVDGADPLVLDLNRDRDHDGELPRQLPAAS